MKTNTRRPNSSKASRAGVSTRQAMPAHEQQEQRQKDKEFMNEMNKFIAKAGLLSDDPFFGGI